MLTEPNNEVIVGMNRGTSEGCLSVIVCVRESEIESETERGGGGGICYKLNIHRYMHTCK